MHNKPSEDGANLTSSESPADPELEEMVKKNGDGLLAMILGLEPQRPVGSQDRIDG